MQQRAVEKSVSRFEPIVEKFAQALHFSLQQLNAKTFPAQCEQEAKHKFRQALETNAQPEPSPAVLYRLSVDAALAAVREGKQLPDEQAWIACTDDATSLKEKEQRE